MHAWEYILDEKEKSVIDFSHDEYNRILKKLIALTEYLEMYSFEAKDTVWCIDWIEKWIK